MNHTEKLHQVYINADRFLYSKNKKKTMKCSCKCKNCKKNNCEDCEIG